MCWREAVSLVLTEGQESFSAAVSAGSHIPLSKHKAGRNIVRRQGRDR